MIYCWHYNVSKIDILLHMLNCILNHFAAQNLSPVLIVLINLNIYHL